jgi:TonB-linked SusC/RagA family outer membrane protein
MKKFYFGELSKVLLLLLVFTSFANFANAQINVTGQVKSGDDDSGLPGVNVIIKGTSVGTVTENDGRYSIEVPSPESVLIFSSIGYISEEISVGNQSVIDLTMVPDITSLEEVVVVGYGTQKKKDLTGSISTVNSEEFSRVPVVDPLQALSGRVAGLSITQTSGMPGAGTEVLVRGVQTLSSSDGNSLANRSKPIFVVDGNITDNIDYISPTDIESMTVLKDASAAAIYGSRAANGVILVTTKRGKVAGKPIITFNAYMGFQGETNLKPETLNSEDYLEIISEAYDNVGVTRPWSDDEFAQYEGVNTDWKDLMLRTGVIQNYNVGVAGSSESSNYFVSANYLNHKGRVLSSDYERYTLRFNSDHSINKWISFGNSLNVYSGETNGASSLYRSALVSVPITRAYEDDGSWGRIRNTDLEGGGNPLFSATRDVKNVVTRGILGNIYVTLEPVSGLKFTSRGSADWEHRYLTNFNPSGDPVLGYGGGTKNSLEKQQRQTLHTTVDFLADYSKTFGTNHSLTVLLGYSIEEWQRETLEGYIEDTPNNNIRYLSAGDPNSDQIYNGFNDWAFLSMFGRINYSLKDKYLLAATIRRDGTSRLIRENRWGNFPSVSAAWKL